MFHPSAYSEHLGSHPFDHPVYGDWGNSNENVGKGIKTGVGIVSAGASGVSTTATLMSAAGASATVPVAGWIVGGVLAATAGTIAIIKGVKTRKVNKKQALAWARSMGLPRDDAEDVAGFVIKLSKKDVAWRRKQKEKLGRTLSRIKKRQEKWRKRPGGRRVLQVLTFGIMRGPERLANQRKRVEAKLGLIDALQDTLQERRQQRQQRQQQAMEGNAYPAQAEGESALATVYGGLPLWAWLAAGSTLAVGGLILAQRRKRA